MGKLPKSIIKKYGISKKAWAVYRNSKKSKSRSVNKLARRKRKTKTRYYGRRKSSNSTGLKLIGATMYGFGREYISDKLATLTSKVPLGDFADEGVMLGLSYLVAKGKIPFLNKVDVLKKAGKAGMYYEAARIGELLANKMQNKSTSTGGSLF
jgi:hypothetical protein